MKRTKIIFRITMICFIVALFGFGYNLMTSNKQMTLTLLPLIPMVFGWVGVFLLARMGKN